MFNPFNLLFTVIDLQEPAIAEDDTAPYIPVMDEIEPVQILHKVPIDLKTVLELSQLRGCKVAYQLPGTNHWITGNIAEAVETKTLGVDVYFQPDANHPSALPKWRGVNEVFYAVYVSGGAE